MGCSGGFEPRKKIRIDELPPSPPNPELQSQLDPPVIFVRIGDIPTSLKYSRPHHYRVYHSNDAFAKDSFLVGEIEAGSGEQVFTYNNARIGEPHFFKVSALNTMGMGTLSECSDSVLIGK